MCNLLFDMTAPFIKLREEPLKFYKEYIKWKFYVKTGILEAFCLKQFVISIMKACKLMEKYVHLGRSVFLKSIPSSNYPKHVQRYP